MAWNQINASYPQVLRGILQQTNEGLLHTNPTYRVTQWSGQDVGSDGGFSTINLPVEGMILRRFELHNRGSAAAVGIGFRWANRTWQAGSLVAADTPDFTDDTTDAQDGPVATPDFPLMNTTAADGWVVFSTRKFSWVSVRIETADVGATADVTADYSNFAGTGWTPVDAASRLEAAGSSLIKAAGANYGDAEERCMVWAPPNNWGRTTGGLLGLPDGVYALRFLTDVATTAASASVIEVGSLVAIDQLAANGVYEQEQSTFSDPWADALVAFFSVADAGNSVKAEVTTGV